MSFLHCPRLSSGFSGLLGTATREATGWTRPCGRVRDVLRCPSDVLSPRLHTPHPTWAYSFLSAPHDAHSWVSRPPGPAHSRGLMNASPYGKRFPTVQLTETPLKLARQHLEGPIRLQAWLDLQVQTMPSGLFVSSFCTFPSTDSAPQQAGLPLCRPPPATSASLTETGLRGPQTDDPKQKRTLTGAAWILWPSLNQTLRLEA